MTRCSKSTAMRLEWPRPFKSWLISELLWWERSEGPIFCQYIKLVEPIRMIIIITSTKCWAGHRLSNPDQEEMIKGDPFMGLLCLYSLRGWIVRIKNVERSEDTWTKEGNFLMSYMLVNYVENMYSHKPATRAASVVSSPVPNMSRINKKLCLNVWVLELL